MKTIEIVSKKFGTHHVLLDNDDFNKINNFKWHLVKGRNTFYAARNRKKRFGIGLILMHKFLIKSKKLIDHKNRNGLDNRRENLRTCSVSQNSKNATSRKNTTSKYLGVYKHTKRYKNSVYVNWVSQITSNYKKIYVGYFKSEKDAAIAHDRKAKEIHGEFANLNFK